MNTKDQLDAVRNNRIRFATMRPEGSQFTTLERRVVITEPQELVALSRSGDLGVLDQLVELLRDPDRAWAAMVMLAAMTRVEEKIADNYSARPQDWWDDFGKTAFARWSKWLAENREKLQWEKENNVFSRKQFYAEQ